MLSAYVVVKEPVVYHYGVVGVLAPQSNRLWHEEGDTFSVSLCPDEWFQIFPCKERDAELFELRRLDEQETRFVDLYRLSEQNLKEIDDWATACRLGQLANPNMDELVSRFGPNVPPPRGRLAILIAWAEYKAFDGIWFTEQISAHMPLTGRGGILQNRLSNFACISLGPAASVTYPPARLPKLILETH